jgi:hypothetical protein
MEPASGLPQYGTYTTLSADIIVTLYHNIAVTLSRVGGVPLLEFGIWYKQRGCGEDYLYLFCVWCA